MTEYLGSLRRKDLFWLSLRGVGPQSMVSWPCTVVCAGWHSEVEEQGTAAQLMRRGRDLTRCSLLVTYRSISFL